MNLVLLLIATVTNEVLTCIYYCLQIEKLLQRNHLPHRIAVDQTYRLQHGLTISSSQQASGYIVGLDILFITSTSGSTTKCGLWSLEL